MRLIVITSETPFKGEGDIFNRLFDRGMETLHLRKPLSGKEEQERLLSGIHSQYYPQIVLHDHFELLSAFPLKGIQLNRRNPNRPNVQTSSVSRSCHSLTEIRESKEFDYLFLSPVFDSLSKKGYTGAFTETELQSAEADGTIDRQVIALGGITKETISVAAGYGFGGVAVLGSLWQDYEIHRDTEKLLQRFDSLKTICEQI